MSRIKGKVFRYKSFSDDFAGTHINTIRVDENYRFIRTNPFWRFSAFLTYQLFAKPTVFWVCRLKYGLRIKNRRAIKRLRKTGFFLYGNHTQALDAFVPHLVAWPHKAYIISNPDAVSLFGLRNFVQMLGCLPLPQSIHGMARLNEAIEKRCNQKGCVVIYPEAHIWPYYTGVRPFPASSFAYPIKYDKPVVAMALTYRRRSFCGIERSPGWTVRISDPIYPDTSLSPIEARKRLRDQAYAFVKATVESSENYEFVHYEYVEEAEKKEVIGG